MAWRTRVADPAELARRAGATAFAVAGVDGAGIELSVALADDEALRTLNRTYRGRDSPTNVLAFPLEAVGGPPPVLLGDVAVAFETARAEADAAGRPLAEHLLHLVVHGTLHLLGHDHEDDREAEAMAALEAAALCRLGDRGEGGAGPRQPIVEGQR